MLAPGELSGPRHRIPVHNVLKHCECALYWVSDSAKEDCLAEPDASSQWKGSKRV